MFEEGKETPHVMFTVYQIGRCQFCEKDAGMVGVFSSKTVDTTIVTCYDCLIDREKRVLIIHPMKQVYREAIRVFDGVK